MNHHQATEDGQQLIPRTGYTTETYFKREMEFLFSRYWNFVGMADDIPNPGDYQCVQAGHYPLVMVRDTEGEIRGFHNVCTHRGMQLVEGAGSSLKGFTCPYHSWFFKLDGRLKVVPQQAALFPDIDKSNLGLLSASVGLFRGMVFIHPDSSPTEDFHEFVAELESKIGPHRPDEMVEISRKRYEFRANWKIVVENYMDSYHLFYLHGKTLPILDHKQLHWFATGRHVLVYEPVHQKHKDWLHETWGVTATECVPGIDPKSYGGGFHMFFPNIGWSEMAHSWSTFHAIPVAVDRTIVESRTRVMPAAFEKMKNTPAYQDRGGDSGEHPVTLEGLDMHPTESGNSMFEDMWACQQMQKGFQSPVAQVSALARKYESMLSFHQRNVLDFVSYT